MLEKVPPSIPVTFGVGSESSAQYAAAEYEKLGSSCGKTLIVIEAQVPGVTQPPSPLT